MEINEALNVAKQLKNNFKAFEKLDEFVKEIASMQGRSKDLAAKKEKLEAEVKSLDERRAKAEEETKASMAAWRNSADEEIRKSSERAAKAKADLDQLEARFAARTKEFNDSISNLEKDHQKKMAAFEQEENAAKGKIESAKREFENLRAKLA